MSDITDTLEEMPEDFGGFESYEGTEAGIETWDEIKEEVEKQRRRNRERITKFLGEGQRAVEAYETHSYYGELLAWTIKCITISPGWETISVHGHAFAEPLFSDIPTDYTSHESCLVDGLMLLKKEAVRLVVTFKGVGLVQVEAGSEDHEAVTKLVQAIKDFMHEHNFYQGKRLSFDGRLSFLNTRLRDWDSVILDPDMKNRIRLNTIGFLKNIARMQEFGISPKRGIILSGDPGTGKTVICKALMSEAANITCITADAYSLFTGRYISDLYSLAQDLSPSMVFIEDLDSIGQERNHYYRGYPPLIALLAEMDGIVEKSQIVTVATSNSIETLDKALSERPSRFDWVFNIARPDYHRRVEILKYLAKKIPLPENMVDYIARKTEAFTPAQLQEVPFSMVIAKLCGVGKVTEFSRKDVDDVLSLMNHKRNGTIGFNPGVP